MQALEPTFQRGESLTAPQGSAGLIVGHSECTENIILRPHSYGYKRKLYQESAIWIDLGFISK